MAQTVSDIFPPSSRGYEHSPMMHVQDQKTTGTDGGTSVIGDNDRDLNTILTNDIVGASLGSNMVTLPAGDYFIEVLSMFRPSTNGYGQTQVKDSNDNIILTGTSGFSIGGSNTLSPACGKVTLTTTTIIKIVTYNSIAAATTGLGYACSSGEIEVYSDIRIWKLDAIKLSPIVHDSKLYPIPGNAYVTGNIRGLEYSVNSSNPNDTIDITAGICYDSLDTTVLTLSANTTATLSSPTINTIYNVFICNTGGTVDIQFDTDVDGATLLAGTVDNLRWLGFVSTDASGNIVSFSTGNFGMNVSFDPVTVGSLYAGAGVTTSADFDISTFLPISRVHGISGDLTGYLTSAAHYRSSEYKLKTSQVMLFNHITGRVNYVGFQPSIEQYVTVINAKTHANVVASTLTVRINGVTTMR